MAVALVTDIVMDVIKAAEPASAKAAHARLAEMSNAGKAIEPFSAHVGAHATSQPDKSSDADAYRKFESLVLGSFIQTMLPDDTQSVYGGGLSGDMWKSILAQHLGDAVSARGGIGIANRLLADQYQEGREMVPLVGANDAPSKAELATSSSLTTAMVQEFQRRSTETLFNEGSITATKADETG
ncbi:MAG: rod-binding protein [Rhizobiaceae bacterium]